MPRRRSTKGRSNPGKGRPVNRADAKIKKWNKASDIPMDEEDLFHASRDKVLLDRDNYLHDDEGDDDEVFALKGLEDEDDEDEDVDMEQEEEGSEYIAPTKQGKAEKSKKKKKNAESSEEEESASEEETWGRTRSAWYSSNAAQLESDDEEGNELEEQEARRLQSKMREEMADADFGLDTALEVENVQETDDLLEPAPVVVESLPLDKKLLLRHLEKTSPETLALARDWEDTVENLTKTQEKLVRLQSENPDAISLGMIHMYYQALLTYTTTLAFYLHLRSSEKYAHRPELLRAHPILRRLLTLKQSLATLEDLDFDVSDSEDEEDDDDESMTMNEILADGESVWDSSGEAAMEDEELKLLLEEAKATLEKPKLVPQKPPKKKRKMSSTAETSELAAVFDLVEPDFVPTKASSSINTSDSAIADAYGEATSLHHADAADKTARKKSLRFHTSKIESASARRQGARNQAVGGDDDIPYRERKKEKEARLAKENAKHRGQGGADLDDTEPESRSAKRRRDDEDDEVEPDGPGGYYELVKKTTKEKKERQKAEYEAMQAAARPYFDDEDVTGPRSLTRAILANKGLTPHRPKSVRNPRVKKRLKFDKAKKKLSSQKAVYKGGLAEIGRYDGEKSGISKVVKSVRLG
ncbi:putative sas10 C-terminal domain [Lyophyllum shimeji]|uniref:Sas10 C-terminal domain n=1 Tax=Lyophyllum shimeji TaxID=47721 RepID=A0A9P3PNB0_LYOSH|nr:putative sas10 C-terminal domain [Lyophyllum shimeji]